MPPSSSCVPRARACRCCAYACARVQDAVAVATAQYKFPGHVALGVRTCPGIVFGVWLNGATRADVRTVSSLLDSFATNPAARSRLATFTASHKAAFIAVLAKAPGHADEETNTNMRVRAGARARARAFGPVRGPRARAQSLAAALEPGRFVSIVTSYLADPADFVVTILAAAAKVTAAGHLPLLVVGENMYRRIKYILDVAHGLPAEGAKAPLAAAVPVTDAAVSNTPVIPDTLCAKMDAREARTRVLRALDAFAEAVVAAPRWRASTRLTDAEEEQDDDESDGEAPAPTQLRARAEAPLPLPVADDEEDSDIQEVAPAPRAVAPSTSFPAPKTPARVPPWLVDIAAGSVAADETPARVPTAAAARPASLPPAEARVPTAAAARPASLPPAASCVPTAAAAPQETATVIAAAHALALRLLAYLNGMTYGTEEMATAAMYFSLVCDRPTAVQVHFASTWLTLQAKRDAAAASVAGCIGRVGGVGGTAPARKRDEKPQAAAAPARESRRDIIEKQQVVAAPALTELVNAAAAVAAGGDADEPSRSAPRPTRETVVPVLHAELVNIVVVAIGRRIAAVRREGGVVDDAALNAQWALVMSCSRDIIPFVTTVMSLNTPPDRWVAAPRASAAECQALVAAGLADMRAADLARLAGVAPVLPAIVAGRLSPRFELVVAMLLAVDDPLHVGSVSGMRRHTHEFAAATLQGALKVRACAVTVAAACASSSRAAPRRTAASVASSWIA